MARIAGIGLAPGDSCYDPNHPWLLPNFLHTAYECNCMVGEGRSSDELCQFAAPGGTPATYTAPKQVPSILNVAASVPGYAAGAVVSAAGDVAGAAGEGFFKSMSMSGYIALAVVAGLGFVYLTKVR